MEETFGDSFQAINIGEVEQRYESIFNKNWVDLRLREAAEVGGDGSSQNDQFL